MKYLTLLFILGVIFTTSAGAQNTIASYNDSIKKSLSFTFNNSAIVQNSTIKILLKDPSILKKIDVRIGDKAFEITNSSRIINAIDYTADEEVSIPIIIKPKKSIRDFAGDIEFLIEATSAMEKEAITYRINHKESDDVKITKLVIDIPRPLWERISINGGSLLFLILLVWFILDRKSRFSKGRFQILEVEGFSNSTKNISLRGKKSVDLPGNFIMVKKGAKGTPKFYKSKLGKKEPRVKVEVPDQGTDAISLRGLPGGQALQTMVSRTNRRGLRNINGCILHIEVEGKKLKVRYNK